MILMEEQAGGKVSQRPQVVNRKRDQVNSVVKEMGGGGGVSTVFGSGRFVVRP